MIRREFLKRSLCAGSTLAAGRVFGSLALPLVFAPLLSPAGGSSSKSAEGWLTWGGPTQDFVVQTSRLADSWPPEGPPKLWERELGDGYSGMAVTTDALYTMYRREAAFWQILTEDQEVVIALSPQNGETLWEFAYDAPFESAFKRAGPGPFAMPQVVGEMVFSVGATGKLYALRRETGKMVWERDLYEAFGGTKLLYGYASHPLPYGDNLIVLVGGEGKAIVALNQLTGKEGWASLSFENSYSTPILINVEGQDQVVAFTARQILGIDPANGQLQWRHAHDTREGGAISTPVWHPEQHLLFFSAAYGFGGKVLRLRRRHGRTEVTEVWHDNRVKVHFTNVLRIGPTLYLSRGHHGPALLSAVDFETGSTLWQTRDFSKASFIWADGKLFIVDEDGHLALATVSSTGLKVHSKVKLLTPNSWTIPSLHGTRLYLRDRRVIMALDVGTPQD